MIYCICIFDLRIVHSKFDITLILLDDHIDHYYGTPIDFFLLFNGEEDKLPLSRNFWSSPNMTLENLLSIGAPGGYCTRINSH